MRRLSIARSGLLLVILAALMFGCAGTEKKPTANNFQDPVISLAYGEVEHYWGWWYFSKNIEPTAGVPGDYGAPLDLAFTFEITNPNPFPVQLENLKFTVAFEEFDLNTVQTIASQWIPPGKTNMIKVHAMFDGRQSLLSLLVTGGFKLEEKGMGTGAGAALKQLAEWWTRIPEFDFTIPIKDGSAVFNADGITRVVPFEMKYPAEQ